MAASEEAALEVAAETPAWVRKLTSRPSATALLCLLAAFYYGREALSPAFAENTRISEHALMPGIVNPQFSGEVLILRFLAQLQGLKDPSAVPAFIQSELEAQGVEAATHYWTNHGLFKNESGQNVVGVVRAHRSTGAEAVALLVPINHKDAVAMAMALASHARGKSYWSRDVFFVFVDGGAVGADAWAAEYHGGGPVPRGGFLVGALVLETPSFLARTDVIHILVTGMNGHLPNLDLFNTVARISHRGRNLLQVMIYPEDAEHFRSHPPSIPFRFLLTQGLVGVEGLHSVMGKYGVQCLTVRAPSSLSTRDGTGRADHLVEETLRALNNLHERFHQSYFLYILVSPNHFSSVAFFFPIVGLLIVPLVVCGVGEWQAVPPGGVSLPTGFPLLLLIGVSLKMAILPLVRRSSLDEDSTIGLLLVVLSLPLGLFISVPRRSLPSSRFFVLVSLALGLSCLSLLNFGLGLISSLVVLPLALLSTRTTTMRLAVFARMLVVLLAHPFSLLLLGSLLPSIHEKGLERWASSIDISSFEWGIRVAAPSRLRSSLSLLLYEDYSLGSWQLGLLVACAIPAWNALVALASSIDEEKEKEKIE